MAFVYQQPRWSTPNLQPPPSPQSPSLSFISPPPQKKSQNTHPYRKGLAYNLKIYQKQNKQNLWEQHHKQIYKLHHQDKYTGTIIKSTNKYPTNVNLISKSSLPCNSICINTQNNTLKDFITINNQKLSTQQQSQKILLNRQEVIPIQKLQRNQIMRTTIASIKQTHNEDFYIGSKDLQCQIGKKNIYYNFKYLKFLPNHKSAKNVQILHELSKKQPQSQQQFTRDKIIPKKPMASHHPFRKRDQQLSSLNKTYNPKQNQKSFDIQQWQQQNQFNQNATPGPGSYSPHFLQTTKKCKMFTQSKNNHFIQQPPQNQLKHQHNYTITTQNSKPSKSTSKQKPSHIAFGKSLYTNDILPKKQLGQATFYQDHQTISNKSRKIHLKSAGNPNSFINNSPRWKNDQYDLAQIIQLDQCDCQQYQHQTNNAIQTIDNPNNTYPFKSTTKKQQPPPQLTSNIDYGGQQFHTISQKLQSLKQSKQKIHNSSKTSLPTHKPPSQPQQHPTTDKKNKNQLQIKYHLIQTIYGFRQKDNQIIKKQGNGFKFNTQNHMKIRHDQSPNFLSYDVGKEWVKPTFNIKFIKQFATLEEFKPNCKTKY